MKHPVVYLHGRFIAIVTKHYANRPMQYTAIFHCCKNFNFQMKNYNMFSFFALKHRSWVHVRTASLRRF